MHRPVFDQRPNFSDDWKRLPFFCFATQFAIRLRRIIFDQIKAEVFRDTCQSFKLHQLDLWVLSTYFH